ncbi:MAG: hypothetical protein WAM11_10580 [Cyanobium sp.]
MSKQPLQRLRSYLHLRLWRWLQCLAPAPLETTAAALATVQPSLTAVSSSTAVASTSADDQSQVAGPDPDPARAVAMAKPVDSAEPVDLAEPGDPAAAGGPALRQKSVEAQDPARPGAALPMPLPSMVPTGGALRFADERAAFCPGQRQPLSVEEAVLARDMSLLRREAADALAALGAAHALVTSARLAQVQHLRPLVEKGEVSGEALKALAADYQGWQNDQVRLFDALGLVMRMQVPPGRVLDQVDPALQDQARQHLASLSVEYQRRQLQHQIQRQG